MLALNVRSKLHRLCVKGIVATMLPPVGASVMDFWTSPANTSKLIQQAVAIKCMGAIQT